MLSRAAYRRFLTDKRRARLMNEWAIIAVIALTFGPLLLADLIGTIWQFG